MRSLLALTLAGCSSAAPPIATPVGAGSDPPPPSTTKRAPEAEAPTGPPQVTNLDPELGDTQGGTYVRIIGTNFITDADGQGRPRSVKVFFGARQGTVVRFASDTELIVQAPGGKDGEIADILLIFEPGGERTLRKRFKYVDLQP